MLMGASKESTAQLHAAHTVPDLERDQHVEHAGDGEVASCDLGSEGGLVAQELLEYLSCAGMSSANILSMASFRGLAYCAWRVGPSSTVSRAMFD